MARNQSSSRRTDLLPWVAVGLFGTLTAMVACGDAKEPDGDARSTGGSSNEDLSADIDDGDDDRSTDADGDGLTNDFELSVGLDPMKADSDGDGCDDLFDHAFPECQAGDLTARSAGLCSKSVLSIPLVDSVSVGTTVKFWIEELPQLGAGGAGGTSGESRVAAGMATATQGDFELNLGSLLDQCCRSSSVLPEVQAGVLVVLDATTAEELVRYRFFATPGDPCLIF